MEVAFEIILVDDASFDNSWNVIKDIKASNDRIKAVRFNKNYGQHNALLCGLNFVTGNYIVTMLEELQDFNTSKQKSSLVFSKSLDDEKIATENKQ